VNILYLDSATEACTAGVSAGGVVVSGFEIASRGHARLLLPMAERLLAEAGIGFADLDLLGFGRGPGSFTGVRIATATAQGIAIARGLPMAPVSSLECLAQGACSHLVPITEKESRHPLEIRVAIDARMGEIYRASYRLESGRLIPLLDEAVTEPVFPAAGGERIIAVGTGFRRYPEMLEGIDVLAAKPDALPRAEHALERIAAMPRRMWIAPDRAIPRYLRNKVTG
jgi:tRNA threonylcarbamoyladenosine biosynthesis protein TsaB